MEISPAQRTVFLQSHDYKEIEALARSLTQAQFLELLDLCVELEGGMRQRLNPLIVGVPHPVLMESLKKLTLPQLQVLRRVADDEPLQYHLTLAIHELSSSATASAEAVEQISREILSYDVTHIVPAELEALKKRICAGSDFFKSALARVDILLSLAWNSNREDLISKLTTMKENWLRYMNSEIGEPVCKTQAASGIYALFDRHFGTIYAGPTENQPLSGLQDDDPAFEALAALGIWYVEDYWELGLLPGISHNQDLRLDSQHYDEIARREFREHLTQTARENLEHLELKTVSDLKRKGIYSRRLLLQYIQANKGTLSAVNRR